MSETEQQRQERELRELEGKNIAHYQTLLSAWISTKMERDKTIVTLSAAAIGLLVTLLTTVGIKSYWEIAFYVGGFFGFAIAIWSSLIIYEKNSDHIEEALRGSTSHSPELQKYDARSKASFVIGACFALGLGIFASINQLQSIEENIMSEKPKGGSQKQTTLRESVNGLNKVSPTMVKKSLDGIGSLAPLNVQRPADKPPVSGQQSGSGDSGSSSSAKSPLVPRSAFCCH